MRARVEPWGAWVRTESPPALVAIDKNAAKAVGIDGHHLWNKEAKVRPPIEVHLAVTSRCHAGCADCYLDARPDGIAPPQGDLIRALDAMKDEGVFTVAFGGGEPITRDDIDRLANEARERGITPVLTTSGFGLSPRIAEKLRTFAQVNVSYDGTAEDYAAVRGFDGSSAAERAISLLTRTGVRVGVNIVLTQATLPHLARTVARATALGAVEIQLLRYKPEGRAASLSYLSKRLSPDQIASFPATLRTLAAQFSDLSFRIDCALVPFLSADPSITLEEITRFGVFGCEAGESLAAVRVDGRVAPCSFAEPTEMRGTELSTSYAFDPVLTKWRDAKAAPSEPCASCAIRSVCKGGCKIVSRFVDGAHASDPECPRVRAYRNSLPVA